MCEGEQGRASEVKGGSGRAGRVRMAHTPCNPRWIYVTTHRISRAPCLFACLGCDGGLVDWVNLAVRVLLVMQSIAILLKP